MLVEPANRDKANGMVGMVVGLGFAITSVFSGIAIGTIGMGWSLLISIAFSVLVTLHLAAIPFQEKPTDEAEQQPKKVDLRGTLKVISLVPGLFALILFATFNNFLGGVFMALMDPYGLSLVSVEVWGLLWGVLSFAFIFGGAYVAKKGVGKNPLRTILLVYVIMWAVCILFPMRSSILMLGAGIFVYMALIPFVEASEQTVLQTVVPFERQGRVFGFAQTVETAAAPVTAFIIGPIAEYAIIPFMDGGGGSRVIGSWFGSGPGRGMALVFVIAGVIGLVVNLLALKSRHYRSLAKHYGEKARQARAEEVVATT
jgi:DHA3 family multidrug efflux protein-like MFS transporter